MVLSLNGQKMLSSTETTIKLLIEQQLYHFENIQHTRSKIF